MKPGTIYIHDRHQLAVFHEGTGYVALAPRDFILCARPDEVRTEFTTSFFLRIDAMFRPGFVFEARGEARTTDLCEGEAAWLAAVGETLDALARMKGLDRHFADLQAMWRGADQHEL